MNLNFPFQFDSRGKTATTDTDDHIRDMIEQFLFTNPGERVNRPDFGSGLLGMVFEPNSPELASALQHMIQSGLGHWLGDLIEVRKLEVANKDSSLQITVQYMIRRTGEQRQDSFERRNVQ